MKLTMPSPMLWTWQGTRAVLPVWAVIMLELSVRKRGGYTGGKEASSSLSDGATSVATSEDLPIRAETDEEWMN